VDEHATPPPWLTRALSVCHQGSERRTARGSCSVRRQCPQAPPHARLQRPPRLRIRRVLPKQPRQLLRAEAPARVRTFSVFAFASLSASILSASAPFSALAACSSATWESSSASMRAAASLRVRSRAASTAAIRRVFSWQAGRRWRGAARPKQQVAGQLDGEVLQTGSLAALGTPVLPGPSVGKRLVDAPLGLRFRVCEGRQRQPCRVPRSVLTGGTPG
jgi:hypothetical protein